MLSRCLMGFFYCLAGDLLTELMQRPRFEQLPSKARQQLLESFGSVLGILGQAMQEQMLRSLPCLVGGAQSAAMLTGCLVHPAA